MMRRLLQRIRAWFTPGSFDNDFDQEMQMHLELLEEEHRRRGLPPGEARRAARVEFGGVAQLREAHRETRGLPLLESLLQDVSYALRCLRKNPGFTALAVLTLAIGIGVNAAVFTVYNAATLRPIQAAEPDRVVQLAHRGRNPSFSMEEYVHYRDHSRSFTMLTAVTGRDVSLGGVPASTTTPGGITAVAGLQFPRALGSSQKVSAMAVAGNYFQLLGVAASYGRIFLPQEDKPGAHPVAMLSDNFWERRFGRDPGLLGRKLQLDGVDATIVGIAPRDFGGTSLTVPDLWMPLEFDRLLASEGSPHAWRGSVLLYGRLRPGVSPNQARDEWNALQTGLPNDSTSAGGERGFILGAVSRGGQPGNEREVALPLVMLGSVSLVLLIACANVASLLLARSAARQREIAIRLAIGASRWRLVRQLLTENAVMSLFAAAGGVVFSWWTVRLLMVQIANSPFAGVATAALDIAPDQRVLGYTLFLALLATMGFGLAPALESSRANLTSGLKDEGAAFGGRLRKSRLRELMVGVQVAVCLALLICAGVLARGSQRALAADLGFEYRNLVSLEVVFPHSAAPAGIAATRTQLAQELSRLPEVQSVAVASRLPLVHGGMRSFAVMPNGGSPDDRGAVDSWYTLVTPGYFHTLGIGLVRGRDFTAQEARDGTEYNGSPVIVSEATARAFWPGEDPIGKRVSFGPRDRRDRLSDGSEDAHSVSSSVIGVVKDVRSWRLERFDATDVYLPVANAFGGTASGRSGRPMGVIALRVRGGEAAALASVRHLMQTLHPELQATIGNARTAFTTQNAFLGSRLGALGAAAIGILGLMMASVGIYGTVAFAVTQRTQEIGIRMALGASRHAVLRLVLAETLRTVGAGLVAGCAVAAAASRLMHSVLFGLSSLDPVVFLGVSAFLAAVALVAGFLPARHATRVNPVVALRYE